MKPIRLNIIFICLVAIIQFSCDSEYDKNDIISVEYPEVYELANIVLALTDYGITDKWQVQKDLDYYHDMRAYFEPFMDHPLLDSVNFSREKWQEYLSYRTDAYAFDLNENYELKRKNDFQAFEITTFDKYTSLTEDFAKSSRFKEFFKKNKAYYDEITNSYRKEYLLVEMKDFLIEEFGDYFTNKKYSVVISPFVYAQNLHRDIDTTWAADFPSVAKQIIEGAGFEDAEDKSTEIHTLFTEMDHGYVNPTSDQYNIAPSFDETIWDNESGYGASGNAVFNEYMTWAVFDIFNEIHFPEFAKKVNLNWHFQNDTRGFSYSYSFAHELKEKYAFYKGRKKVKDLYPEMMEWTKETQSQLSKPILLNDSDTLQIKGVKQEIKLLFSESMRQLSSFDIVFQYSQWDRETVRIGEEHNVAWADDGTSVTFDILLPSKSDYYLLLNWWGVSESLTSEKGIQLKALSGFVVEGET